MPTAADLRALLVERYPAKEWVFLDEVPDASGFNKSRTIDHLAMHRWPSKGHRVVAFEVKVDRGDFKREIEDPTKRAPWEELADECYFVTSFRVARKTEIPEGWGLIQATKKGDMLRQVLVAQQRKPKPWPRGFAAMMIRRAAEQPSFGEEPFARYMGEDLTYEQLGKLAELFMQCTVEGELMRRAYYTQQQTERLAQLEASALVLRKELGLSHYVVSDAEQLRNALQGLRQGLQPATRNSLKHIITAMRGVATRMEEHLTSCEPETPTESTGDEPALQDSLSSSSSPSYRRL